MGHETDNLTVPIGPEAELDTENATLRFKEPAVCGGIYTSKGHK